MFHIVDDDSETCMLIGAVIHHAGYDFIHFYSAMAYLKYMQTRCYEAPVALLVNYIMPDMNGCKLVEEVIKKLPNQKAILIANHAELNASRPNTDRFYACLERPIHDDILLALLNDLLIDHLLYPQGCAHDGLSA